MDATTIEERVHDALIAELIRQSGRDTGLRVTIEEDRATERVLVSGPVSVDELVMAVVGALAGGP